MSKAILCAVTWYKPRGYIDRLREKVADGIDPEELEFHWKMDGYTPLHCAVIQGPPEVVKLLLSAGANPSSRDDYETTPLHYAIMYELIATAHILLDAGADVNAADSGGNTPLYWSARTHQDGLTALLLDRGAHPGHRNNSGETAFDTPDGAKFIHHYQCRVSQKALVDAASEWLTPDAVADLGRCIVVPPRKSGADCATDSAAALACAKRRRI